MECLGNWPRGDSRRVCFETLGVFCRGVGAEGTRGILNTCCGLPLRPGGGCAHAWKSNQSLASVGVSALDCSPTLDGWERTRVTGLLPSSLSQTRVTNIAEGFRHLLAYPNRANKNELQHSASTVSGKPSLPTECCEVLESDREDRQKPSTRAPTKIDFSQLCWANSHCPPNALRSWIRKGRQTKVFNEINQNYISLVSTT